MEFLGYTNYFSKLGQILQGGKNSWHGRSLQPGLRPPAGKTSVPERQEVSPSRKNAKKSEMRETGVKRKKRKRGMKEVKKEKAWRGVRSPSPPANRIAAEIKYAETLNGSELLDGPKSGQLTSQPSAESAAVAETLTGRQKHLPPGKSFSRRLLGADKGVIENPGSALNPPAIIFLLLLLPPAASKKKKRAISRHNYELGREERIKGGEYHRGRVASVDSDKMLQFYQRRKLRAPLKQP